MARKNPYIPHLAEFYFRPTEDWTIAEAEARYRGVAGPDRVEFRDCVAGMRELPAESVDCIITDPPFGLGFTGRERFYNRDAAQVVSGYIDVAPADYPRFSHDWIAAAARLLRPTGTCWVFSGYTHLRHVLNALADAGLTLINDVAWIYSFAVYAKRKFATEHYHLLFAVKDPENYYFNTVEHYVRDHWEIRRDNQPGQAKNGTKLPEAVVRRCIDFGTRPGDVVLDPFVGNGTVPAVARKNFRRFLGFELNGTLEPVIQQTVGNAEPGFSYTPYASRLPTPEDLGRRPDYAAAYRAYQAGIRPGAPPAEGGAEE